MKLKAIKDEDFINFSKCSMFLGTTQCDFKCDRECGKKVCQNSPLAIAPIIEVSNSILIERYLSNPLTKAIVIGGLEPFDTFEETFQFIADFREKVPQDEIVIYTGYTEKEIEPEIEKLKKFKNITVKFGRYIPNQDSYIDPIFKIQLASKNQYFKAIS